jgi:hypothetical protein
MSLRDFCCNIFINGVVRICFRSLITSTEKKNPDFTTRHCERKKESRVPTLFIIHTADSTPIFIQVGTVCFYKLALFYDPLYVFSHKIYNKKVSLQDEMSYKSLLYVDKVVCH